MLTRLKALDSELREGLADLGKLISQAGADEVALSSSRLKLARLIGGRRALIQCTIMPCLHDVPPASAAQLVDLRLETAELAVQFSKHISRWTTRAIEADWAGYQTASVEMRRSLLRRIDGDAAILYPLLREESQSTLS